MGPDARPPSRASSLASSLCNSSSKWRVLREDFAELRLDQLPSVAEKIREALAEEHDALFQLVEEVNEMLEEEASAQYFSNFHFWVKIRYLI